MLITLAVAFMLIVTGSGPHEKRMIPPARTAATTAAEVQLAGVPRPTTRLGCEVSTPRPAAGTGTGRTAGAERDGITPGAAGTAHAPTSRQPAHAVRTDTRPRTRQG